VRPTLFAFPLAGGAVHPPWRENLGTRNPRNSRKPRVGRRATDQAGQRMAAILGHVWFDARQFRDLRTLRWWICAQQQRTPGTTTGRAKFDDSLDLVKRFE
jgi:hypothetical protein